MELVEPRSSKHGLLTAKVAREISPFWDEHGFYVLYDHDASNKNVGKIMSRFGESYGREYSVESHRYCYC